MWSSRERKAADAAAILAEHARPAARARSSSSPRTTAPRRATCRRSCSSPRCTRSSASRCSRHRGWETAAAAQERIADAIETVLARSPAEGDVAIVSHGGVGTLLLCQLKGTAIHRAEDQPGQGHWFAFDRDTPRRAARLAPARLSGAAPGAGVVQARMPHPGPRRAAVPVARPLPAGPRRSPASASAQGWTCEASALAVTLGPSPRTEPITANKGEPSLQGGLRRRQRPRLAAAGHRQPAERHDDLEPPTGTPSAQTASAAARPRRAARSPGCRSRSRRPTSAALPGPQTDPGRRDDRHPRRRRGAACRALQRRPAQPPRAARRGDRRAASSGAPQLTGTSSVLGITVLGNELPVDRIDLADDQRRRTRRASTRRTSRPSQLGLPGVDAHPAAAGPRRAARRSPSRPTVATVRVAAGPQDRGRRQARPSTRSTSRSRSAARTSSTSRSARRPSAPRTSTAAASPTSRCSARRAGSC